MSYKRITVEGYFEADEDGLEPEGLVEALMGLGITDLDIQVEDAEDD